MFDGKLYMSCDELDGNKHIYCVDVENGDVQVLFTRNVGADENGEPVFCVLDRGARRKSSNLTRYKICQ